MGDAYRLRWVNRAEGEMVFHVRDAITVGRAADNDIVLDEDGISRRHCRLSAGADGLVAEDLGSTNGTFVNGQRVQNARLADGDELLLGRAVLKVESGRGQAAPGGAASAARHRTRVTTKETIEVVLAAGRAEYAPPPAGAGRSADHLRALCAVIDAINAGGSPEALYEKALDALLETLDMDLGAVIAGTDPAAAPAHVATRAVGAAGGTAPRVSRTVLARVLASGEAVLANDVSSDEQLSSSTSLAGAGSARILCAPIAVAGRISGALYLAAGPASRPASEAELRLATLVARQLALAADNLSRQELLAEENRALRREVSGDVRIAGSSAAIKRVLEMAQRAARTDVTVLLTGETGTGKELVARALHEWSGRKERPFVAVNCGAIPTTMVESELFGHEKGAFTGAAERRLGRFELARDGTLFLDEIGELPLEIQVKLLRVLEDRRFYRVGGTREIFSDVRVVAATNRDLDEWVKEGRFREDLLYRIRVLEIRIPPLRERPEDIAEIAEALLAGLSRAAGRGAARLTAAARKRLLEYDWPGNVRELRNRLERALILADSATIDAGDLLPEAPGAGRPAPSRKGALKSLKELEREHIREVLEQTGWNKSRAAEVLGIGRTNVYEKIKLYGLEPPD